MRVCFCACAPVPNRQISDRTHHTWTLGSDSLRALNTLILQTLYVSFSLVLSTFAMRVLSRNIHKICEFKENKLEYFESRKIYQGKV